MHVYNVMYYIYAPGSFFNLNLNLNFGLSLNRCMYVFRVKKMHK